MMNEYDDIINMPHHVSERHPRMSMYKRAAQFKPFFISGYKEEIEKVIREYEAKYDENGRIKGSVVSYY